MAGPLTIAIILVIFFVAGGFASNGFRAARARRREIKELRQRWTANQRPRISREWPGTGLGDR